MEISYETKAFKVVYRCDECLQASMKFTGDVLTSDPPQYPHRCDRCGHKVNLDKVYPRIEHRHAEQ